MPYSVRKQIFRWILAYEHFPSLNFCRCLGECYLPIEFDPNKQIVNLTIRTLVLNKTTTTELNNLFSILPNLHNLEATLEYGVEKFTPIHTSLERLRLTFPYSTEQFENINILFQTPNLKRLRMKGKIEDSSVLIFFEKLAGFFHVHLLQLQIFNCELYFHARSPQAEIVAIRQLHPLFKSIVCHLGDFNNQCYATDLTEYRFNSEYSCNF